MTAAERPQAWDLVLGGRAVQSGPSFGLVLGGIEGAQRRLNGPDLEVRLSTITELPSYGESGITVLIEALQSNTQWAVRLAAWRTLSTLEDPQAQQAILDLSPFRDVGGARGLLVAYRRGEREFSYAELGGIQLPKTGLGGIKGFEANLKAADLSHANLSGAHLIKTDLRGADLSGAKLSGADLSQADLRGAKLVEVKLSGTNLRDSLISEETVMDRKSRLIWELQNCEGRGRQLSGSDLSKADLRGLDLQTIDLSGSDLLGVDLQDTNLRGANLSGAILFRGDLRRADLSEADLSGADLTKADLSESSLRQANLVRADIGKGKLCRADLQEAQIEGLKHSETQIEGVIFPDGSPNKPWWW